MNGSPAKNRFRPAQSSDVLFMLNLVRDGYKKNCSVYGIKFDGPSTLLTIANALTRGLCLVGPSSCAGAIITPFPYNHNAQVATVLFWCFKSSREIAIFGELLKHCRDAGATHISASSHFPDNSIGRFYAKNGLHNCEIQSIRPI